MRNRKNSQVFFGIVFVTIAIVTLLTTLTSFKGLWVSISLISLFSLYGLYSLLRRSFFIGSYSLAYALYIYLLEYYIVRPLSGMDLFLIATALGFGLSLLFGKKKSMTFERTYSYSSSDIKSKKKTISEEYSNETYMFIKTQFSGDTRYIYSPNLEVIDIENQFAGTSIYFQERNLNNDLNINIDCQLGAVELYFPKEWNIIDNLNTSLAGVDYGHKPPSDTSSPYRVYLNGSVQLGGIEINYI